MYNRVYWKSPFFAAGCEVSCGFPIDSIIKVYGQSCVYYVGRQMGERLESMAYRFSTEEEARYAAQCRYARGEISNWQIVNM